jgi:thioredoxin 1
MPQVEKLAEEYEGKLKVTKVDASQNRRLCISLRVLGLPTFLFYKNGEEVNRLSGGDLTSEEIGEAARKITA